MSFERRFTVVGEAEDGQSGVQVVADEQPDAVILDVMMPVMDGLEAIAPMRQQAPDAKIVVLSSDPAFRQSAMDHGAHGFHEKGEPFDAIADTIVRLVQGAA